MGKQNIPKANPSSFEAGGGEVNGKIGVAAHSYTRACVRTYVYARNLNGVGLIGKQNL